MSHNETEYPRSISRAEESCVTDGATSNETETFSFRRMVGWLAGACLAVVVLAYLVLSQDFTAQTLRAYLLDVLSNITATLVIFLVLFRTLTPIIERRQDEQQKSMVRRIVSAGASPVGTPIDVHQKRRIDLKGIEQVSAPRRRIVDSYLDGMLRTMIAITNNTELRMYCHVADRHSRQLYPISCQSFAIDDDSWVAIPYEGDDAREFVVADAMRERKIVARNLPPDHIKRYPRRLRRYIRADLKCVVAWPVQAYGPPDQDKAPFGVVSLDCVSSRLVGLDILNEEEKDVNDEIGDMLKQFARTLNLVLTLPDLSNIEVNHD